MEIKLQLSSVIELQEIQFTFEAFLSRARLTAHWQDSHISILVPLCYCDINLFLLQRAQSSKSYASACVLCVRCRKQSVRERRNCFPLFCAVRLFSDYLEGPFNLQLYKENKNMDLLWKN